MEYVAIAPNRDELTEAGYASVAHVPYLIREDGFYPGHANRYLRARALCEWSLRIGTDGPQTESQKRFLTSQSCWGVVRRLVSFLNWCEATGRKWETVTYVDDVMVWQKGLIDGTGSTSGERLAYATVNVLVAEACYFLTWASEVPRLDGRPARGPFLVAVGTARARPASSNRSGGRRRDREVAQRVGALRPRPSQLCLPSPRDVGAWMGAMKVRFPVKSLMAESVIEVGLRASEVNQMREDTLPPREKWAKRIRAGKLPVWITHGIKGPKISPESTESVRPREVLFPVKLAERIDHYRSVTRLNQIARWIRAGDTPAERASRARASKPDRLWLSESSFQPFANQQFYSAWTSVGNCPEGWHPHKGRDYFAVETIVSYVRADLDAHRSKQVPDLSWLQGAMREQVRLLLSPLLGHIDDETTMIYLRAVHIRLVEEFGHPALRWQQFCDAAEETVE